jgi:hypothetical protein
MVVFMMGFPCCCVRPRGKRGANRQYAATTLLFRALNDQVDR